MVTVSPTGMGVATPALTRKAWPLTMMTASRFRVRMRTERGCMDWRGVARQARHEGLVAARGVVEVRDELQVARRDQRRQDCFHLDRLVGRRRARADDDGGVGRGAAGGHQQRLGAEGHHGHQESDRQVAKAVGGGAGLGTAEMLPMVRPVRVEKAGKFLPVTVTVLPGKASWLVKKYNA